MNESVLLSWIPTQINQPWQRFLIVILVAFVAAKALNWIVATALKGAAAKTSTELDDRLIALLHRPLMNLVMLLGLLLALQTLGWSNDSYTMTAKTAKTLILTFWVVFAFKAATLILQAAAKSKKRLQAITDSTFPFFDTIAKLTICAATLWVLIGIWEWNATGWLASAGVVGIAVSFAARDTLANLFAGILIIADAPYRVGDYIVLETGERGEVTQIGLRSTRIVTRDDVEVIVPNGVMGNAKVYNETAGPSTKARIRVKVSVAYGTNVENVREILLNVAKTENLVCRIPEPRVRFRNFGASGLDIELLCWIEKPVLRGRAIDDLNKAIYHEFDKSNIEIPFPKQDVYVRKMPEQLD